MRAVARFPLGQGTAIAFERVVVQIEHARVAAAAAAVVRVGRRGRRGRRGPPIVVERAARVTA
jgi:hypothetical protein